MSPATVERVATAGSAETEAFPSLVVTAETAATLESAETVVPVAHRPRVPLAMVATEAMAASSASLGPEARTLPASADLAETAVLVPEVVTAATADLPAWVDRTATAETAETRALAATAATVACHYWALAATVETAESPDRRQVRPGPPETASGRPAPRAWPEAEPPADEVVTAERVDTSVIP